MTSLDIMLLTIAISGWATAFLLSYRNVRDNKAFKRIFCDLLGRYLRTYRRAIDADERHERMVYQLAVTGRRLHRMRKVRRERMEEFIRHTRQTP